MESVFVRYLHTHSFVFTKLTRSQSLARSFCGNKLLRKYRTSALSMKICVFSSKIARQHFRANSFGYQLPDQRLHELGQERTKSFYTNLRSMLFLTNEPAKKAEINILTAPDTTGPGY